MLFWCLWNEFIPVNMRGVYLQLPKFLRLPSSNVT